METDTIQINGRFFKVSKTSMAEIELLVSTLYGTCQEPFLSDLNRLLGKIVDTNPPAERVEGLTNFEYII